MKTYKLEEVCRILNVPMPTLRAYILHGHFIPSIIGTVGRNNPHRFSLMQVVGIGVAEQLKKTMRGASNPYAGQVIMAFSDMEETVLIEAFENGRVYFDCVTGGKNFIPFTANLCKPTSNSQFDGIEKVNVSDIYHQIKNSVLQTV